MSLNAIDFQPSAQERRQALAAADQMADGLDYVNRHAISQARDARIIRARLNDYFTGPVEAEVQRQLAALRARRNARQHAQRIGLAYWPALLDDNGVAPQAFVAAEQVLARKSGGFWGESLPEDIMHHGGWDAMGHYGPNAAKVARYWFAAGCKDSEKFRLQVSTGIEVKKGDSLPFARNFVRGLRWVQRQQFSRPCVTAREWDWYPDGQWPVNYRFSRKAVAALGRLSPEARAAACRGLTERNDTTVVAQGGKWLMEDTGQPCAARRKVRGYEGARATVPTPVRVRDLNWAEVRRYTDALAAARNGGEKTRVRIAWASAPRAAKDHAASLAILPADIPRYLCPHIPGLSLAQAQAVARGMSQSEIVRAVRPASGRTISWDSETRPATAFALLPGDCFARRHGNVVTRFGPVWQGGNISGFQPLGVAVLYANPAGAGQYWEHGADEAACAAEYAHKVAVQAGREAQAKQTARDARAVRLMRRMCKKAVVTRFAVRQAGACQAGIESWLRAMGWPASQDTLTVGQLPPVRDWPGYLGRGVDAELFALRVARTREAHTKQRDKRRER